MTALVVTPANRQELNLLKEMLQKMQIKFKPLSNTIDTVDDDEELYRFAMMNLSRAYCEDEPEYTSDMIKEQNPDYKPSFKS